MKSKSQLKQIVAALADDIVTVACVFSNTQKEYFYKCPKEVASHLKKRYGCCCAKRC